MDRPTLAAKLTTMCELLGIAPHEAAEVLAEVSSLPPQRTTLPTVEAFLPVVEAATKPGARKTYATYWRRLAAAYGGRRIDEVRTSDLERLRNELPNSDETVRRSNWRNGYQAQRTAVQAWRKFWAVVNGQ